jgi:multicomponent Na+:H+ antiporter subunit B
MRAVTILRIVTKLLIPYILLFALYVQFHGDFGPGGGFQAGVIFAAGLILYSLVFGLQSALRVAPPTALESLFALGVLLYAGTGIATMLMGGNFLDYNALNHHHPAHGQHWGLLIIELGVGVTVASGMLLIFYAFAGRERMP